MRGELRLTSHLLFISNMRLLLLSLLILLNFLVASCDSGLQGNLNENIPPTTSLTLNEINLPEGERLVSQVNISWWGDDPDGFIAGYEFFMGDPDTVSDNDWVFTQKTDSTFILPIPEGEIDADVQFTVRAIDNDDARDEDPPSLIFPIRNTKPEIRFNFNETPPDTTYRIASFGFTPSDPDGDANLNRMEIALNDTSSEDSWQPLSLEVSLITLKINDAAPTPYADVLVGRSAVESDISFDNVIPDGENTLYVRAIDNAAETSDVITKTWYVKKQTSNILFLNDYWGAENTSTTNDRRDLHLSLLRSDSVNITNVDYIDISDGRVVGGSRVQLSSAFHHRSLAAPTLNLMFAQWDYIYWISDDLNRNIGYAQQMTTDFFDQGGKMFINIPIKYLADRHPLLQFLPFKGVQQASYPQPNRSPQFMIGQCSEVTATNDISYTPYLRFRNVQFPTNSIIPFDNSIKLFEADYNLFLRNPNESTGYEGDELIAAMNNNESILYFGFDLNEFTRDGITPVCKDENGDEYPASDLEGLMKFLIKDTLGFEQ